MGRSEPSPSRSRLPSRAWLRVALTVGGLAAALPDRAEPPPLPPVQAVLDKLENLWRGSSSVATLRMEIRTADFSRDLVLKIWTRGDRDALILVRAPAREAGTATLRTAEGLWTYAPRADEMVRIPSALLSESWMGSHFTNDDLVRETSFTKDYEASVSRGDQNGKPYLFVDLVPRKDAPVVWTRIRYRLDPTTWLPEEAQDFDGREVVRTMRFGDVRTFGDRNLPSVVEVVPAAHPDESTRLTYEEARFDARVDPSLFTLRSLRRLAHGP